MKEFKGRIVTPGTLVESSMLDEGKKDALKVQTYLGNLFNGINVLAQADEDFDVDEFIQQVQEAIGGSNTRTAMDLASPLFIADFRGPDFLVSKYDIASSLLRVAGPNVSIDKTS